MAANGSVEELDTISAKNKLNGISVVLQNTVFDLANIDQSVCAKNEKERIIASCLVSGQWINNNNTASSTAPLTLCENSSDSELRRTLRIDRSGSTESVVTTSGGESSSRSSVASDIASEPSSPSRPVTPMPPVPTQHCLPYECLRAADSEDSGLGPSPAKSIANPTSPEGSVSPIQFGRDEDDRSDSLLDLSPRTDNSYESEDPKGPEEDTDHHSEFDNGGPTCTVWDHRLDKPSIPKSPINGGSAFQFLLSSNNCVNSNQIRNGDFRRSPQFPSPLLEDVEHSFHRGAKVTAVKSPLLEDVEHSFFRGSTVTGTKSPLLEDPFHRGATTTASKSLQFPSPLLEDPFHCGDTTTATKSLLLDVVEQQFRHSATATKSPLLENVEQPFHHGVTSSTAKSPLLDDVEHSFHCGATATNSPQFPSPLLNLNDEATPSSSFFGEQARRQPQQASSSNGLNLAQIKDRFDADHFLQNAHLNPKVVLIRSNFSRYTEESNSHSEDANRHELTSSDCTSSNCSQVGGPVDPQGPSGVSPVDDGACKWENCNRSADANTTATDLIDHIRQCHVQSQTDDSKSYVCLWVGCKVYDRPSCSRSWLERHVLLHGGSKPFRCIVDGCNQRFSSEGVLERHVNSHFLQNRSHKGGENASRLCRKKRHKQRKRPLSNKSKDFFDDATMEHVRHNLFLLSSIDGMVSGGPPSAITFRSSVIGRRMDGTGKISVLLHWNPEDILPDSWVPQADVLSNLEKTIPVSRLPRQALELPSMATMCKTGIVTRPGKRKRK